MMGDTTAVMTIRETAEYLRIPCSSLYKLAQDGKIPARKIGRHWRFHRQVIDDWLKTPPSEGVAQEMLSR